MNKLNEETNEARAFKASRFWTSNVSGAVIGGIGGVILMSVLGGIAIGMTHSVNVMLFVGGLTFILILSLVCLFAGNLIAAYPYAVIVEAGKGLRLCAPLRTIYIPIGDVRDVRQSLLQQGVVVRLKRRQRLLKSFVIHSFFGNEAEPLVNAIRQEVQRNLLI